MAKKWRPEEDLILKDLFQTGSRELVMSRIHREWPATLRRARKLGLRRDIRLSNADKLKRGPRKDRWSTEEEELLKMLYPTSSKEFIKSKVHRTWQAIWNRAYRLGLKRDPYILVQERGFTRKKT